MENSITLAQQFVPLATVGSYYVFDVLRGKHLK